MKSTSPPAAVYGEAGRDAGLGRALAHLAGEPARAEPLAQHARRRSRVFCVSPFATRVAALRQTSAIRRSRFRTPASRVYSRMIVRSTLVRRSSAARA